MTQKQFKRRQKSWKGCTICRAAKRKCTEEHPRCAHCLRNGLQCQYDISIRFRVEEFVTENDQIVGQKSRKMEGTNSNSGPKNEGRLVTGDAQENTRKIVSPSPFPEFSLETSGFRPIRPKSVSSRSSDTDEISSNDLEDSEQSVVPIALIAKEPQWTDILVDPVDSKYFHFFTSHLNNILIYANLFPAAIDEIFARAVQSKPLRHVVLSMSSKFIDRHLQRSNERELVHKQEAIISLQQCLSTGTITEDIAIAICLMIFMDCFSGRTTPQTHLRGLYLVLKELHLDSSTNSPLFWDKVSPVVLLIWRIALRLDTMIATIQQCLPVFPPFPAEYNALQRNWAVNLAKDGRSADWAIASFALDNFYQRAIRWAREAGEMYYSAEYSTNSEIRAAHEALTRQRIAILRQEHSEWLQQPACILAMQMEKLAQQGEIPSNIATFLDYPPVIIYDRKFNLLLNEWRAQYLFIEAFIAAPLIKRQHTRTELSHAIEICRTHAALALGPISKDFATEFFAVLTTGYAFAGGQQFQREFTWVVDRIAEIDGMKHPLLTQFQHFLDKVKNFEKISPDWDDFDEDAGELLLAEMLWGTD